ncbi:MAG: uracil-DNA glycosylase [Alphaproteobacteria bacterium]|nr:uracil-DNA glycosylase [Alphaproteobacteria bacterium]
MSFVCPDKNCTLCPRLLAFRAQNEIKFPSYYNGPVESFGSLTAEILIVGLAPGLNGANQTNRPFTNDYAGDVLYPILQKHGLARGNYRKRKDDGFELLNVRVTNSVRCVPPQNKVTGEEVKNCGGYLTAELAAMPNLKIILTLGSVAHSAVLGVLGYKKASFKFAHGAVHRLERHGLLMVNSYHTSRYNINTGVLTAQMFEDVVANMLKLLTK